MDPSRPRSTQPIPSDVGIAKSLADQDLEGVFLIPDIAKAIADKLWMRTTNDDLPDVKTLMVAPINAVQQGQRVMIGILYLTSKEAGENALVPADTIPLKAFADALGLVYPLIMRKMAKLSGGR